MTTRRPQAKQTMRGGFGTRYRCSFRVGYRYCTRVRTWTMHDPGHLKRGHGLAGSGFRDVCMFQDDAEQPVHGKNLPTYIDVPTFRLHYTSFWGLPYRILKLS